MLGQGQLGPGPPRVVILQKLECLCEQRPRLRMTRVVFQTRVGLLATRQKPGLSTGEPTVVACALLWMIQNSKRLADASVDPRETLLARWIHFAHMAIGVQHPYLPLITRAQLVGTNVRRNAQ